MKARRGFLVALAVSLAVHLLVLSGSGWRLPLLEGPGETTVLDARLATPKVPDARPLPAQARPKPSGPRQPKPPRPPKPRKPEAEAMAAPDSGPAESPPAVPAAEGVQQERVVRGESPVAEAASEPEKKEGAQAPAEIALPRWVRIHYRVTLGEGGFVAGEANQELRHDGITYVLSSTMATTGLAALFRPVKVVNVSEGQITAEGLRPVEFRVERSSGRNESARFDWQNSRVTLSGDRHFELAAGTQDMLSLFCQLALVQPESAISIPVLTSKKVEQYNFEVLGEERIRTPRGERTTLHLRNQQADGREATEVWLDPAEWRLPVKIRHTDRRGDMFEQIADRIEYQESMEDAH